MTRAGEKLYSVPELSKGSASRALVTDTEFRRGFHDVARLLGTVLILLFVGLHQPAVSSSSGSGGADVR